MFSIFVCIEAYKLNIGTYRQPGPGFFPFLTGAAFGLLALLLFFLSFTRNQRGEERRSFERTRWRNILLVLVVLYLYALVLEKLGFLVSSFLFVAGLLWIVEGKKWYVLLLVGGIAALTSYAIFQLWLQSQLPKGILGIF